MRNPLKHGRQKAAILLTFVLGCSAAIKADANTITATTGNASDVSVAISNAADGDTVYIPDGSYTWSTGVVVPGTKTIHLLAKDFGQVTITDTKIGGGMLEIDESSTGNSELAGINFASGGVPDPNFDSYHVVTYGYTGKPVVIHDCTFFTNSNIGEAMRFAGIGGVIYNCTFNTNWQANATPIAIAVKNDQDSTGWNMPIKWGNADDGTTNVYIENNTFNDYVLDVIDVDGDGRAVVRYNTFNDSGMASHGVDTGPMGARSCEVYNNTFVDHQTGTSPNQISYPEPVNWWVFERGGCWLVHNNVFPVLSGYWGTHSAIMITDYNIRRSSQFIPCQTSYPSFRQPGQDLQNGSYVTVPCRSWNNTDGNGNSMDNDNQVWLEDYGSDDCGNNQTVFGSSVSPIYLEEGRDYIIGTAPSGYTTYTYPHPLDAGSGGSPSPTPTPTPTPTPSPTPTPTPPASNDIKYSAFSSSPGASDGPFSDSPVNLGVQFTSKVSQQILSLKAYLPANNPQTTGYLFSGSTQVASVTFPATTAAGWQQVNLSSPVTVNPGVTYTASYYSPSTYFDTSSGLASSVSNVFLSVPANGGLYAYGAAGQLPNLNYNSSNYWADVVAGYNSLWSPSATPAIPDNSTTYAVTVGMQFYPTTNGTITDVAFYKTAKNTGTHTFAIWSNSGTQLVTGTFTGESASGWQYAHLATPLSVTANTQYVVGVFYPVGHYSVTNSYWTADVTKGYLVAPKTPSNGNGNGLYERTAGTLAYPHLTYANSNYFVDVVFVPGS